MKIALACVVVAGIGIGLVLPGASRPVIAAPPPAIVGAPELRRETVIERSDNGHFYTVANVNGEPIKFVVDTGATDIALTVADARRLGLKVDSGNFYPVARTASGVAMGQAVRLKTVDLDGKSVDDIGAVVLDGLDISLLGQNYLRHVDLRIAGDAMVLR